MAHELSPENFGLADDMSRRARDRMPGMDLGATGINSYIASLTDLAASRKLTGDGVGNLEAIADVYGYIRDNYGARTVRGATHALRQGRVDPGVVEDWIGAGLIVDQLEFQAVSAGYPGLADELSAVRRRKIAEHALLDDMIDIVTGVSTG